jgi:hypothetical protein
VDARDLFVKAKKSLGEKRKQISDEQIDEITRLYGDFAESGRVKILPNEFFGYQRITVERPLKLRWRSSARTSSSCCLPGSLSWSALQLTTSGNWPTCWDRFRNWWPRTCGPLWLRLP